MAHITKIITVSLFVILIGSFVAFRMGLFDGDKSVEEGTKSQPVFQKLDTDINYSVELLDSLVVESLEPPESAESPEPVRLLPSSKSLIIHEVSTIPEKPEARTDSLLRSSPDNENRVRDFLLDSLKRWQIMHTSSKSGAAFEPKDLRYLKYLDSIQNDTL